MAPSLIPDSMTVQELLEKWIPIQSSKHKWSPKTYTQTTAMVHNLDRAVYRPAEDSRSPHL